jgi:predicted transcriptional regulator
MIWTAWVYNLHHRLEMSMETVKERVRLLVEKLPDDCTWELVAYRIMLSAKIAKGEADIEAGCGIPHEQVMREIEGWLESSGALMPLPTSSAI